MLTTSQEIYAQKLKKESRRQVDTIHRCEILQSINSFLGVISMVAVCHSAAVVAQEKPLHVLDVVGCVGFAGALLSTFALNKREREAKEKLEDVHRKLQALSR